MEEPLNHERRLVSFFCCPPREQLWDEEALPPRLLPGCEEPAGLPQIICRDSCVPDCLSVLPFVSGLSMNPGTCIQLCDRA
jgi:hypothetical protein